MELHVKNGASKIEQNLQAYAEQKKVSLEEAAQQLGVELPRIPHNAVHWWEWFWELSSGRAWNMAGLQPLAWQEIKAWAELNGLSLETWELRLLRAMDAAFLRAHATVQQKTAKSRHKKRTQA